MTIKSFQKGLTQTHATVDDNVETDGGTGRKSRFCFPAHDL